MREYLKPQERPSRVIETQARQQQVQGKFETIQQKPNNTGLPDNLKSGVENMSGLSMDDVRVHYNSDKPAQMQAHAYTQGTDIHVAPNQERHLPHEAWHVVQQMQGRVQPTMQMQGVNVNDNEGLEREADVMGWQAVQRQPIMQRQEIGGANKTGWVAVQRQGVNPLKRETNIGNGRPVQMATKIQHTTANYNYIQNSVAIANVIAANKVAAFPAVIPLAIPATETVGRKMEAYLDPTDPVRGTAPGGNVHKKLMDNLPTVGGKNQFKGHLLNYDLGGYGVEQNLFPITKTANDFHSSKVEKKIKNWLYGGTKAKAKNLAAGGVYYEVNIISSFEDDGDPDIFHCIAGEWNPMGGGLGNQLLDVDIQSNIGTLLPGGPPVAVAHPLVAGATPPGLPVVNIFAPPAAAALVGLGAGLLAGAGGFFIPKAFPPPPTVAPPLNNILTGLPYANEWMNKGSGAKPKAFAPAKGVAKAKIPHPSFLQEQGIGGWQHIWVI